MLRRILAVAVVMVAIFLAVLFGMNRFSLCISLKGEPTVVLEYGEVYEDPGVEAWLQGTLLLKDGLAPGGMKIRREGTLPEDTLGRYTLRYTAEYLWFSAYAERTVAMVDTQAPILTLLPDPEQPEIPYREAGYYAFDLHDGDITDRVIRRESMGLITYSVTDSSGNPAYAQRHVPFHDPVPPELFLEGGAEWTVSVGRPYEEPGYSALDNVDGILTDQVLVEGSVNVMKPGLYPVSYRVTDAYGNTAEAVRHVTVAAASRPETVWPEEKTIYLTFDDGPGPHTLRLLDILDRYGVKATFFVVDSEYNGLMQQIVDRGHSIGIHSVTHDYGAIYSSPEAYFEDLFTMQRIIYENTGVLTSLMRFPGGSSNEVSIRSCEGIMSFLTQAVQDAGFQFFDWNVDSDDAGGANKKKTVLANVRKGVEETGIALVLQHDIHGYSVDAVEEIIRWGLNNGYVFQPLRENSPPFHHPLNN